MMDRARTYRELGESLSRGGTIGQFMSGLALPFKGFGVLLRHTSLLANALLYTLISLSILGALLVAAFVATGAIVEALTDWTGFFYALAWIGIFIVLLLPVYLLWRVTSSILTASMQERLSRRTEEALRPDLQFAWREGEPLYKELLKAPATIVVTLVKGLAVMAVLLGVNTIPIVGQIVSLGVSTTLAARELGLELFDMPLERRDLSESQVTTFIKRHRGLWFGVGFSTSLLTLVPLLNLVVIPGSVVGAALAYQALESARQTPEVPWSPPLALPAEADAQDADETDDAIERPLTRDPSSES